MSYISFINVSSNSKPNTYISTEMKTLRVIFPREAVYRGKLRMGVSQLAKVDVSFMNVS